MTDETRALFRVGVVRDVTFIGGTMLAAAALGSSATEAFACDGTVYISWEDGTLEPFAGQLWPADRDRRRKA